MFEYFMICLAGLMVFFSGYSIKKGNINLLHLHNRIMILDKDKKAYCNMIGTGLNIFGSGIFVSGLMSACFQNDDFFLIMFLTAIIGLGICYWAMLKYNMYRKR